MSHFSPEFPKMEFTGRTRWGRGIFRLTEPLKYEVGRNGTGLYVEVPVMYETDFASVPFLFWWLAPPTGKYGAATIVHDYMCEHYSGFSRVVADAVFLEAMRHLGAWWWRRMIMFMGVRAYWLAFGKWKRMLCKK